MIEKGVDCASGQDLLAEHRQFKDVDQHLTTSRGETETINPGGDRKLDQVKVKARGNGHNVS